MAIAAKELTVMITKPTPTQTSRQRIFPTTRMTIAITAMTSPMSEVATSGMPIPAQISPQRITPTMGILMTGIERRALRCPC